MSILRINIADINYMRNLHFINFIKFNLHKFRNNNKVITNAHANEVSA